MKIYSTLLTALIFINLSYGQNLFNGLQACYPFDGNASNYAITGASLNGTPVNVNTATGHSGIANTAYQLNGDTASFIELPNDSRIKSDSVTFSGWFYIDALPGLQYLVYTKNNCGSNFEAYYLCTYYNFSLGQQAFIIGKSDNVCQYAPHVISSTAPVVGNWYHIVFYIDNSVMKLYVNGVMESFSNHTTIFDYNSTKNVYLGVTRESNYNFPFKGRIDDVRFYDRPLTQQEITILYTQQSGLCTQGPAPVATFTASIKQICKNQSIIFTDQSTNSPTSWNWQIPGASPATSTLSNPVISFPQPGIYTVSLTTSNSNGTSSNTAVQTITVSACTSVAEFTASKKQICKDQSVTFTDQSTNSPTSWNWQIPGASPATSTLSNPVISFPQSGIYTVSLTTSNSNGTSSNTAVQTITVSACTSVAEISNSVNSWVAYPNPANDKFYIDNAQHVKMIISDITGKNINFIQTKVNEKTSEINMNDSAQGIYFIRIFGLDGNYLQSTKVILKK